MRTDVMAAVTYLKREADSLGFDRNGFIAAGESAGGHLSLWLAVEGKVSAVLSISGLHDLSLKMTAVGEKYRIVQKALGPAYPSGIKDFSPLNFVSNSTPPVYFLHGEKDPWVQFEHSTIAESKLKALGVKTRAVLVKGMGHGIKPGVAAEKKALDNFVKWLVKVSE
jgi:dipeptidyl aminopeptidase/acylaminoacyl peptidase